MALGSLGAKRDFVDREQFVALVQEVWDQLPEPFAAKLENVVLLVDDEPSPELLRSLGLNPRRDTLFGLYQGVPLSQRGAAFGNHPPDTITIFYRPLVRRFRTTDRLRREIERTIVHEVAHYFGMSERQIRKLGY
jgi:predicted Zn-dependent protease with MMP-like domain